MTNGFALKHDTCLKIYFFCVKVPSEKRLFERSRKHSSPSGTMFPYKHFIKALTALVGRLSLGVG